MMWNRSGIEFAACIPFYPDCATTFVSDTDVADGPIRIFGGTRDDYNPIALCKAYVERLKAAGRDVQLTEYPDAPHAFDNPFGPVPAAVASNAQTVRHCVIREEPTGLLINASTRQGFTYKDPWLRLLLSDHASCSLHHRQEKCQGGRKCTFICRETFHLSPVSQGGHTPDRNPAVQ